MKTKFLLTLLAVSGLCLCTNSTPATATAPTEIHHDISNLSRTISALIDLDEDTHSLVNMAIDRALLAQQTKDINIPAPVTAGVPRADLSQTDKQPVMIGEISVPKNQVDKQPIGRIAKPNDKKKEPSIGQTTNSDRSPHNQESVIELGDSVKTIGFIMKEPGSIDRSRNKKP